MRKTLPAMFVLVGGLLVYTRGAQRQPPPTGPKQALLIRFDGPDGMDFGGGIRPTPTRLAGWQFDSRDSIDGSKWRTAMRKENYWDTPYEKRMGPTSNRVKVTAKGLIVEYATWPAEPIEVETEQGKFSVTVNESMWTAPARFLDGKAEVRIVPAAVALTPGVEAEDYPAMLVAKDGKEWLAYQAWTEGKSDRILVRKRLGAGWSQPEVLASGGDYHRVVLAEDKLRRVWAIWSAQENGNFDLYGRAFNGRAWGARERITSAADSDIFQRAATAPNGTMYIVYQSARNGNFDIFLRSFDGKKWSAEKQISESKANDWEPAIAISPAGRVTVLWDSYDQGNYDIMARDFQDGVWGAPRPIVASGAFEARVSASYDSDGKLWMAWDEGDWNWGKDYGNAIPESGRGLMVKRQARVAVIQGDKLFEPISSPISALPEDFQQVAQQPLLSLDNAGNPWLFFRYRVNLPRQAKGGEGSQRTSWRMGATRYSEGKWTPVVEFAEGFGRIDSPAAVASRADGMFDVAWISDGRQWPDGAAREQDLFVSSVPQGVRSEAPLRAFTPDAGNARSSHPNEAKDVERVRAYRMSAGGQEFRIARGDIHRHTDMSWDGNRDGSLNDAYRYALDAAAMDYIGVCDHGAGQYVPYHWWVTQKAVDLFTITGRFTPLYSYERSLPYPNGHRNVLFSERGKALFQPSQAEQNGIDGAAKLYGQLRRLGGLTTSHTSATGAGTDWRDSDPAIEPIVEVYQGYRHSYEGPATPRATAEREDSRFAAGFVSNAWKRGLKLGVQASSDHVSTHISYAAVFVDRLDRKAILDAYRARRSYAATDNIIVDFRMGDHPQGAAFEAGGAPVVTAVVEGTGPIAKVSVIKNNIALFAQPGEGSRAVKFQFTDARPTVGDSYYHIRVEQEDGQLAWSSPIWVRIR